MYDQGTITDLGPCPTEFNFDSKPGAGACKVEEDRLILIGGPNKKAFIYDVTANDWEEKAGMVIEKLIAAFSFIFIFYYDSCSTKQRRKVHLSYFCAIFPQSQIMK